MTAQSWVETTLPPGYVGHRNYASGYAYGFGAGGVTREGWLSNADRNRAAWRHWTAAVLRGRGHSKKRGHAGPGFDWQHPDTDDQCEVPIAWCGEVAITIASDGRYAVGHEDQWYREKMPTFDDIDEAMARFASLVMYYQGPAMKRGAG